MAKIILASASMHRRRLLKLLGLKFVVRPSKAKELIDARSTCARLVVKNALLKAKDVAASTKEGIVVGADTLVELGDGRIIGKPKNIDHAKRTLRALSHKPSFVYTGLALIDAKTKRTLTGYEKTKVIMQDLSNAEIDHYYRHVSPFDKAGGFDIEGRGGVLIKRIEGCYFNVVGLPLSKLYQLLKKMGVSLFLILAVVYFGGCATEYNLATQQQETLMYGTDKEVKLGDAMSQAFEKEFKLIGDVDANERVSKILKKIVAVCDRKDIIYAIKIVDDKKVNAVSLPGGYIYVNKGLLDNVDNDDQLAGVIGHEVGHITARHSIKKIQSLYGYTVLQVLSATTAKNADFARGVDLAFASVFLEYSREDEFMADKLGVKYMEKAGYKPSEMANFLKKLAKIEEKEPANQFTYWRTHPYVNQRIAAVNQEITGSLGFKDYLNLVGEK